jgi:hypothetical protein
MRWSGLNRAIFIQRIEKVKIAFPALASAERLLFAHPTRRFRWIDGSFESDAKKRCKN